MGIRIAGLLTVLGLSAGAAPLHAQEATERYIPVGQSPGLSGVYTDIGEIVTVDEQAQTITVRTDGSTRTIQITSGTHLWLDRSPLRQRNTTGRFSDLLPGRTVEVKYVDEATRDSAYWIKVVIEQG